MTCPNLLSSSSVDNVSNNSSGGSSSVDFPINTSMFMLIPIMLGVLIFMLFFRWTYHNRGGKDINVKK